MLLKLQTSGKNVEYVANIMNVKNTETALTNEKMKLNRTQCHYQAINCW